MGYASALAWVLFGIIVSVTAMQFCLEKVGSLRGRTAMSRTHSTAQRAFVYGLLMLLSLIFLLPVAWLVRSSLCDQKSVLLPLERLSDFIPRSFHPENFLRVFQKIPFFSYTLNTLIISVLTVVGSVLSSSLCAYGFTFCQTRSSSKLFYGVLATMMLPGVVLMVPQFILFRHLGWIDTIKPLVIPAFFGAPFAIFLFRQFFLTLPGSLVETARVEGANNLQIYTYLITPLAKPVTITVTIFAFMGSWNDFMGPLIFLNSQKNWTLQVGLSTLISDTAGGEWHLMMAATLIALLPVLLVFFFLQKYFVQGIASSGLKN